MAGEPQPRTPEHDPENPPEDEAVPPGDDDGPPPGGAFTQSWDDDSFTGPAL